VNLDSDFKHFQRKIYLIVHLLSIEMINLLNHLMNQKIIN